MTAHALLSPSSSHRWIACPGSKAGNLLSDDGSDAADEGTRLHNLAADYLGPTPPPEEPPEAIEGYLRFTKDLIDEATLVGEYHVERTFASKQVPDHFGTADFVMATANELWVVDLKTGRGEVAAEKNDQLACYLNLLREEFPGRSQFYGAIVQFGTPDTWRFPLSFLDEHRAAVTRAASSDARCAGSHCVWCPLLAGCDEARGRAQQVAAVQFEDASSLDPATLKELISFEPVVAKLAGCAKLEIQRRLMVGEQFEGWRLAEPLSNRRWIDEDEVGEHLVDEGYDFDDIYETSLQSPSKIEKLLKKKKRKLPERFVTRDSKPVIAVPETSKLPVYDPSAIFSG